MSFVLFFTGLLLGALLVFAFILILLCLPTFASRVYPKIATREQFAPFRLPDELKRAILSGKSGELSTREHFLTGNLILHFLYQELRGSKRLRRWILRKLQLEFNDLICRTAVGKLVHDVSIQDVTLGSRIPVLKDLQVHNVKLSEDKNCIETLELDAMIVYVGGFKLAISADIVLGRKALVSLELSHLSGRARIKMTRHPYTYWALSFVEEPRIDLNVESSFQGRPLPQLVPVLVSQLKRTIKRKHVLPNFKLRHKPFFLNPFLQPGPDPNHFDYIELTGFLEVTVISCSRLNCANLINAPNENWEVYCVISIGSKPLTMGGSSAASGFEAILIKMIRRPTDSGVGLTLKRELVPEKGEKRITVVSVEAHSGSDIAGFKAGDVLVSVNGVLISSVRQANKLLGKFAGELSVILERRLALISEDESDRLITGRMVGNKQKTDKAVADNLKAEMSEDGFVHIDFQSEREGSSSENDPSISAPNLNKTTCGFGSDENRADLREADLMNLLKPPDSHQFAVQSFFAESSEPDVRKSASAQCLLYDFDAENPPEGLRQRRPNSLRDEDDLMSLEALSTTPSVEQRFNTFSGPSKDFEEDFSTPTAGLVGSGIPEMQNQQDEDQLRQLDAADTISSTMSTLSAGEWETYRELLQNEEDNLHYSDAEEAVEDRDDVSLGKASGMRALLSQKQRLKAKAAAMATRLQNSRRVRQFLERRRQTAASSSSIPMASSEPGGDHMNSLFPILDSGERLDLSLNNLSTPVPLAEAAVADSNSQEPSPLPLPEEEIVTERRTRSVPLEKNNVEFEEEYCVPLSSSSRYFNLALWMKHSSEMNTTASNNSKVIASTNIFIPELLQDCSATLSHYHQQDYTLKPNDTPLPPKNYESLLSHIGFDARLCYGEVTLGFRWCPKDWKPVATEEPCPEPEKLFFPIDAESLSGSELDLLQQGSKSEGNENKAEEFVSSLNIEPLSADFVPPTPQKWAVVQLRTGSPILCDVCKGKFWRKSANKCGTCYAVCHKNCVSKHVCQRTHSSELKGNNTETGESDSIVGMETSSIGSNDDSKSIDRQYSSWTSDGRHKLYENLTTRISQFKQRKRGGTQVQEEEGQEDGSSGIELSERSESKSLRAKKGRRLPQLSALWKAGSDGEAINLAQDSDLDAGQNVNNSNDDIYNQQLLSNVKTLGREKYADLPLQQRKIKLTQQIAKLEEEMQDATAVRLELLNSDSQKSLQKLDQIEAKIQSLSILMLQFYSGLQHCIDLETGEEELESGLSSSEALSELASHQLNPEVPSQDVETISNENVAIESSQETETTTNDDTQCDGPITNDAAVTEVPALHGSSL